MLDGEATFLCRAMGAWAWVPLVTFCRSVLLAATI